MHRPGEALEDGVERADEPVPSLEEGRDSRAKRDREGKGDRVIRYWSLRHACLNGLRSHQGLPKILDHHHIPVSIAITLSKRCQFPFR